MLTKQQKEEFIEDGRSSTRREDFARAKSVQPMSDRCLDELLKFLKDMRQFSSPEFLLSSKSKPKIHKL